MANALAESFDEKMAPELAAGYAPSLEHANAVARNNKFNPYSALNMKPVQMKPSAPKQQLAPTMQISVKALDTDGHTNVVPQAANKPNHRSLRATHTTAVNLNADTLRDLGAVRTVENKPGQKMNYLPQANNNVAVQNGNLDGNVTLALDNKPKPAAKKPAVKPAQKLGIQPTWMQRANKLGANISSAPRFAGMF